MNTKCKVNIQASFSVQSKSETVRCADMRFFILALLMVAGAILPVSAAHADDAKEQLRQAMTALVTVPAYRMVSTYSDPHGEKLGTATLECVRPDAVDLRYEQNGHITKETLAVGKKVYFRQGTDGRFKGVPGDVATLLLRVQSESLQTFKMLTSVAMVGHQTLNGEPTSIYKFDGELAGAHSHTQIWISDNSHLPLKADALASIPAKSLHNQTVRLHTVTAFTYGPSLKLFPPSN